MYSMKGSSLILSICRGAGCAATACSDTDFEQHRHLGVDDPSVMPRPTDPDGRPSDACLCASRSGCDRPIASAFSRCSVPVCV